MRALPSQGRCHAVFLLAYTARLKPASSLEKWIAAARQRSTIMAAAADLAGTAEILRAGRLVADSGGIVLGDALALLAFRADRTTLVRIAGLLLNCFPPGWIATAVNDGQFLPELIPSADLETLKWLGADLGPLVLDAHRAITTERDDRFRKALGDLGELVIMAALQAAGHNSRHVALVSDAYGYDIEYDADGGPRRVEVKTAFESTAGRVVVSRHEVEKAKAFKTSWKLVQVVLSSSVVVNRQATAADVLQIRELSEANLAGLIPEDRPGFKWIEAAELRPSAEAWLASPLTAPPEFKAPFAAPA